jgi:hypothetical protein
MLTFKKDSQRILLKIIISCFILNLKIINEYFQQTLQTLFLSNSTFLAATSLKLKIFLINTF